jgi:hypothetical protein
MMKKYAGFRRSQIEIALNDIDRELLRHTKNVDPRRVAALAKRAELLAALEDKDREIYRAWERSRLFSNGTRKP